MTMLDSVAVFESRAQEIGLEPQEIEELRERKWNTFGTFAFACGYAPGGPDETRLLQLASKVTRSGAMEPDEARMPAIRRLYFEAYTMCAADMKMRLEAREDDRPRKLANVERSQRYDSQAARLRGLDLTGEMEVSHSLIDLIGQFVEDNALRYCRWEQATKREQESQGAKLDSFWKPDLHGNVKEVRAAPDLLADMSTDLLLKHTLARRSLAFDQWRLVAFEVFEQWSTIMLTAYLRTPPNGYAKVSLEQLHNADVELFHHMMKATRRGIKPTAEGNFPVEDALKVAMDAAEVRLHLQPLQSRGTQQPTRLVTLKRSSPGSSDDYQDRSQKTIEGLQTQIRQLRAGSTGSQKKGAKGQKGGGGGQKGGSKGGGSKNPMPHDLIGMERYWNNEPICYGYNLAGCDKAAPGVKCPKGWHVCCRPGCFQHHGQRAHP